MASFAIYTKTKRMIWSFIYFAAEILTQWSPWHQQDTPSMLWAFQLPRVGPVVWSQTGQVHSTQLAFCWHSNLAQWRFSGQSGQTGQTSPIHWSDRSKQVCQIVNWTAPLRRSRRDDRNPYIEHPIWSPDERVMALDTGSDWSDRSGRPVRPVQTAVRV